MIWWCEGSSSFENIYRGINLKGSQFDGDMKRRMFHFIRDQFQRMVYCSSRERVQRQSRQWCFSSQQMCLQSPETRVQRMICVIPVPENRMVCGVGSTSPVTTVVFLQPVVMIFVKRSNDMVVSYIQVVSPRSWSTCVDWGGILRIQEGYIGGLHGGPAAGVGNTPRLRGDVIGGFCRFS